MIEVDIRDSFSVAKENTNNGIFFDWQEIRKLKLNFK